MILTLVRLWKEIPLTVTYLLLRNTVLYCSYPLLPTCAFPPPPECKLLIIKCCTEYSVRTVLYGQTKNSAAAELALDVTLQ